MFNILFLSSFSASFLQPSARCCLYIWLARCNLQNMHTVLVQVCLDAAMRYSLLTECFICFAFKYNTYSSVGITYISSWSSRSSIHELTSGSISFFSFIEFSIVNASPRWDSSEAFKLFGIQITRILFVRSLTFSPHNHVSFIKKLSFFYNKNPRSILIVENTRNTMAGSKLIIKSKVYLSLCLYLYYLIWIVKNWKGIPLLNFLFILEKALIIS